MKTSEYPVWLAVQREEREKMRSAAGKLNDGRSAVAYSKEDKLWFARPGCDLELIKEWLPDKSMRAGGGDPEAEFLDVLTQGGLVIKGMPVMDGKRQSVATVENKNGKKSGVYAGFLDRRPGGWYINYHKASEVVKWSSSGGEADPVARVHIRAAAKQSQEDSNRERAENYARQTRIAKRLYDSLPPADPAHPYLVRKGITATPEIRQTRNGALVVPFFSAEGDFKTLQYIPESGDKRLFKGGPKKEHFLIVGGPLVPGQPILYAEGYATARSVNMATNRPVVMTIDAGNMVAVAKVLQQKNPNSSHLFMADLDHAKQENKGLLMAVKAAHKVGGHVAYPVFNEREIAQGFTDFNDLHQSRGLDALRTHMDSIFPSYTKFAGVNIMHEQSSLDPLNDTAALPPVGPTEMPVSSSSDDPAAGETLAAANIATNSDWKENRVQSPMTADSAASHVLRAARAPDFEKELLVMAEWDLNRFVSEVIGKDAWLPIGWTGKVEVIGSLYRDGVGVLPPANPANERDAEVFGVYAENSDGSKLFVCEFESKAQADEVVSKLQTIDANALLLDETILVQPSADYPTYAQPAEDNIMQEQPSLDPQEKLSVLTPAGPAETQASTAADAPAMDAISVAMNIPQNSDQQMMSADSAASRILKTVRDSGFSSQLLPVAEVALKRHFSNALGPFINSASDGKVSVDIPVRWTGGTEITGYVTQEGVLFPAGEQTPDFLSVYAKDHDGTSVWVADFNSQARADEFVSKLQAIDTNARSLDKADSVQLYAELERAAPIVDSAELVDKAQQSPSQDALARQIQSLEAEEAQIRVNLKGYYDNYDSEGATIYEAESGLDKLQGRLKELRDQASLSPTLDATTDASAVVSNLPPQTDAQPKPESEPEIENSVEANIEPANAEPSEPVNPSPALPESFVSTQAFDEVVTALPPANSQVTESSLKTPSNDSVDVSMSEPLNVPPPLGTADPDADSSATMKLEGLESLIPRRARVEAVSAEPVLDAINVGPRIGKDEPPLEPSTIDKDLLLTRITTETQNDQSVLYKLDNEPAFVDRGTRLEMAPGAGQSDEKIVAALITAARFYRGQIELTGSDAFKAKAIELIANHRINVSMKNPAQQLMLDQARQALNVSADKPDAIHGETPAPFDPAPPVSTAKEVPITARPTQSQSQTTAGQQTVPGSAPHFANAGYTPMDVSSMAASEQQSAPMNSAADVSRASAAPDIDPAVHTQSRIAEQPVTGKIMDYGTKPFRFDPKNTESVYITMRTKSGTQTFWGKELAGLLRDTRIEKGRMATLQWLGQYPVTVKVPIKDQETGKVLRFADKEAVRNQWSLSLLKGPTVRTDDDQGVKLMAYDAARFSMIQHSIIAQLNVPIELPHHPSDGLFWMTPNGQGSAKAGDELSAPRPAVDSKSAGSPVISSWSADGQLDMALFRGDGPYLQGVVRQGDQYQHVLVSLPGTDGEPPMVINQITDRGLVPIGVGNAINRSGGEPVAREHIAFKLEGDSDVRIAKLDFPSEIPPALHHRLGFDERWKDTNNLPKSSPAAAPTAQPNVARPY
ncbi:LPD7 domain-containing protein [Pseudomonas alliivorans]|nr:LPD7 domain-containing protein [Pseudomonas alliivorans]